jgi:ribosomal protein L22
LEEYLKRKSTNQNQMVRGDLTSSSIFESERNIQDQASEEEGKAKRDARNPANMAPVLDPKPRVRMRWQRKMVIREMKRGGRLSSAQYIKRTEREHQSRSHNMKTSIKKLGPLARQIAGKTIDEAITQMQFSKKKVAKELLQYLEYARDEAIVKKGMGLGSVATQDSHAGKNEPIEIQLKDGKRHTVSDTSKIYVDQAWVGRGPYGKSPDYRARGQMYIMETPWTSISLVLKEENTRVREWNDREEKRRKERDAKVWVPLPDRPIQSQQQWYSW